MRLWHKDLIPYLPRQQLLGQWRELNSIYKLQNKHILINFVYEKNKLDLYAFSLLVLSEMKKRNYKVNSENFEKYFKKENNTKYTIIYENIYFEKMNERYLLQCLYNLQEKYDCGGISKEEWKIIEDRFGEYLGE